MSINDTAYDTTACSGYRYTSLMEAIQKAQLMGGLHQHEVMPDPHAPAFQLDVVQGGNSSADGLAYFKHPIFFKNKLDDTQEALSVCLDVREFGKYVPNQDRFVVRNGIEYAWHIKRAVLNRLWVDGRIEAMRDISTIPVSAYAALISESIARRFALDPVEQMTVATLAAYFYYQLFTDVELSEDERNRVIGTIGRITKIPAQKVFDSLEGVLSIHSIESLCSAIKDKVANVALENLNVGTLFAVTCGNWSGSNAREVMAVGLEHIPTWLMIVSASLGSATYKRSTLAKITARYDKAGSGQNMQRSLELLLGGPAAISLPDYALFY